MLSLFSEYLSPTNLIASGIVKLLQYSFSIWCVGLLVYGIFLLIIYWQIRKNQNIQSLVATRQDRNLDFEDSDPKVDAENVFAEFCKKRSLGKGSPVAKHLKAIFLAGWDESRLEVGELINHTTSNLFRWNSLFRSVLAVFIVIGLLGTLFGLTDSLTELSPALKESVANETTTENNERMTQILSELLDKIKGAFAPSIWGIVFTIAGVILYGVYLQIACHPVKSILERLTLATWVPQLYPTTSQKLIQTLHESEAQMRSGYQTAVQVGELVENVQGGISDFNENLKRANAITQPLSDSASQINKAASQINSAADMLSKGFTENLSKFSQEFAANVNRLTGFQDEIRSLHQQFQEAANQKLNQQTQKLEDQTQNLANVLDTLKNYEEAYIKSREQIDETLQKFINVATEANTSVHERNREWFEKINAGNHQYFSEIHSQLKTDFTEIQQTQKNELKTLANGLATNLENAQRVLDERLTVLNNRLENFDTPLIETVGEIRKTFDEQLKILNNRLENFDTPLIEAANQVRGTFRDLVNYMNRIVGDLQMEIKKQNESYAEQLTGVRSLNASVVNLLNQLDENSKNQKNAVNALSSNVGELTADTQNLAAAITSFTSDSGALSHSIAIIEKHTGTLGTASQQFVEKVERTDVPSLTANLGKLNTVINEISQNSQTLANAANTLVKQVSSLGEGNANPIQQKIPFLQRIRILFLGSPSSTRTSVKSQSQNEQK